MDIMKRIQALAQELKDDILRYVVVVDLPAEIHPMKPGHGLPPGLHINKALRLATAQEYYGKHSFHFDLEFAKGGGIQHPAYAIAWFSRVSQEHKFMIELVHFRALTAFDKVAITPWVGFAANATLLTLRAQLELQLMNTVLRVDWYECKESKARQVEDHIPGSATEEDLFEEFLKSGGSEVDLPFGDILGFGAKQRRGSY